MKKEENQQKSLNNTEKSNNIPTNIIAKNFGEIIDEYENKYEGPILNGAANGYGIKYYKDGRKYIGEFKNNLREGKGILYRPDGTVFKGTYKNDIQDGEGININKNGKIFKALFKNGKVIRGSAIMYYLEENFNLMTFQYRYEGDYKNNKREGFGIFNMPNNDKYEGEFQNNKYNGKGKYIWGDGSWYEGGFNNDQKDGKGVMYFDNGAKINGLWKEDNPIDVNLVEDNIIDEVD